MVYKRIFLPLLFLIIPLFSLIGQVDFYWENERVLAPGQARFPQVRATENEIMSVWQEFNDAEGTVSFYYITSPNGILWTEPQLVTEPVVYFWEDQVSLFSLLAGEDGTFHIAFPQNEQSIGIYRKEVGQGEFFLESTLSTTATNLAPRLYEKNDGGLIIFSTQSTKAEEGGLGDSSLDIIYTEQRGSEWTPIANLVTNNELTWNFLPDFYSYNGREYVVFQSLDTGVRITWQLYLQSREEGSEEWSEPIHLTGRDEFFDGVSQEYIYFDNQRPHLSSNRNGLILTWERHYSQLSTQIYLARLNDNGQIQGEFEVVTSGFRYNANPRYFEYKEQDYILWFDNRDGNQVIMSRLDQAFLGGERMSRSTGNSSYAMPLVFKGDLYLFWENQFSDRNRLILLAPDKSVNQPVVIPISFTRGERSQKSLVTLNWTAPADSSGIEGYLFSWDQQPDTDPSLQDERLLLKPRPTTFTATEDGLWYFHISVRDNAGNWSIPLHVPYYRDTTPPLPIRFIKPGTDAFGALKSNSPLLAWQSEKEEDLAGYSYSLTYLGNNPFDLDRFTIESPPQRVMTTDRAIKLSNRDNGYWALVVGSLDRTGNMGKSEIFYFYMNKYIPVTYISFVGSSKNREESIVLDIRGRGFSVGGQITRVLIDRDREAPWDYEYYLDRDFTVPNDRQITGLIIDDMREGIYHIAVEHPQRGLVFASNRIRLDSTGNVKFGDFTQGFEMGWDIIKDRAVRLALNRIMFYLIILFLVVIIILSTVKMINLWSENRDLETNAKALIEGTLMMTDLIEERLRRMKKKGTGLRTKFTLAFLALVVSIVLLVALVLGNYMITTQQISLGEELEKRSRMIVDTLASGAENYLPSSNRIELSLLPSQIAAMDEALNTTITGKGYSDPNNFNYIWASNNEDINLYQELPGRLSVTNYNEIISALNEEEKALFDQYYLEGEGEYLFNDDLKDTSYKCAELLLKIEYLKPFSVGNTPYWDIIERDMKDIKTEINTLGAEQLTDMVRDFEQLNAEAIPLFLRDDNQSRERLAEIQETQSLLSIQINNSLSEITNRIGVRSEPAFNPAELLLLNEEERTFTFYKPLVYREKGSETYYRGTVRLEVTVEPLINQILSTRQNIIYITGLTFLIAIAVSIFGAILLSSTMIKPIQRLAGHVQLIRDTEDITALSERMLPIKSRDELGELGENINQMTLQLVKAAAANKELIVGKGIQKTFLPLEVREVMGESRKMTTTGKKEYGDLELYGYYEGAKGVSGDYFDIRPLDEDHYAIIKCDISGKGIAASFLMSVVATLFVTYCKDLNPSKKMDLTPLLYSVNDLIYEIGFQGRFAAFTVLVLNKKTGKYILSHAGDSLLYRYDDGRKEFYIEEINEAPAAGQIDSFLVEMKAPYIQSEFKLDRGDILFLLTDGIEESKSYFRDSEFNQITCDNPDHIKSRSKEEKIQGLKEWGHGVGEDNDELNPDRLNEYMNQFMHRGTYELVKYHTSNPNQKYEFNFTNFEGSIEEIALAPIALEKMFRLHPYANVDEDHVLQIDANLDKFLQKYFVQYSDFFKMEYQELRPEFPEYVYYRHLDEDDQTDDLTCLIIRRN